MENLVKEYAGGPQLLAKKWHWYEHINFFSQRALEALGTGVGSSLLNIHVQGTQSEGKPYSQFMVACVLKDS